MSANKNTAPMLVSVLVRTMGDGSMATQAWIAEERERRAAETRDRVAQKAWETHLREREVAALEASAQYLRVIAEELVKFNKYGVPK